MQVGETVVPFKDLVEISGESIMEIDQYLGITEDYAQKGHQSKKRKATSRKNGWWSCLLMMYRRQLLDFVSDFFAFQ